MMMFLMAATFFLAGCNNDFSFHDRESSASFMDTRRISQKSVEPNNLQSQSLSNLNKSEDFYHWASSEGYPEAQMIYAQLLLRKNQTENAYSLLLSAYEKGYDEALILMAQNLDEQGKTEEALRALEPLLAKKTSAQVYILAAQFSKKINKIDQEQDFLKIAAHLGSIDAQHKISSNQQYSQKAWKDFFDNREGDFFDACAPIDSLSGSKKEESIAHLETIAPRQFWEIFRHAAHEGSPYAALAELVFSRSYPTLFEGNSGSYRDLMLKASSLPAGKSFYARAILDGSIQEPYQKAWDLLREAAEHKDPYALFALSFYYREIGMLDKALAYYNDGLSQSNMADDLFGVIRDIVEKKITLRSSHAAYDALSFLAYSGHAKSQVYLASLKEQKLIEGSAEEIITLLHRAAWANNHYAQYLLGTAYFYGQKGLEINYHKAWRWLLESARSGYRPAQYTLGQWYWHHAYEKPGSKIEAYAWKRISLEGLKEEPLEWLRDIEKDLSWSELEAAVIKSQQYHDLYNKTVRIEMPASLTR